MSLSNDGAGENAGFIEKSLEFCDSSGRVDDFAGARSSCFRWVREETSERPDAG